VAPSATSARDLSPALHAPTSRRALLDLANENANTLRHRLAGLLDAREFEACYGEPPGTVIRFG